MIADWTEVFILVFSHTHILELLDSPTSVNIQKEKYKDKISPNKYSQKANVRSKLSQDNSIICNVIRNSKTIEA